MPFRSVASPCPVCTADTLKPYAEIDGYPYYECTTCESLSLESSVLAQIDAGEFVRPYDVDYWAIERAAAKDRSWGPALARVAEVLLYARIPVRSFVDIGTGPGYLLDALALHLPSSKDVFWGVEAFPPSEHSAHQNYHIGRLGEIDRKFQAGCCIEMLEHLTPSMAMALAKEMAARSDLGAIYIFNTGLPSYVKLEDPGYLDPLRRGHIVSYGLAGVRHIFEPAGFTVIPLPGKTWAFLVEYGSSDPTAAKDRIWTALAENKALLADPETGSLMYVLGLETARAYSS